MFVAPENERIIDIFHSMLKFLFTLWTKVNQKISSEME